MSEDVKEVGAGENREFWAGLSQRKLLLQYDTRMARYQFYPKPISSFSLDRTLEWRVAAGTGVIVAFTLDRTRETKGGLGPILALIRLDEGPRILAPIVDCGIETLKVGADVELFWVKDQAQPYQFRLTDRQPRT